MSEPTPLSFCVMPSLGRGRFKTWKVTPPGLGDKPYFVVNRPGDLISNNPEGYQGFEAVRLATQKFERLELSRKTTDANKIALYLLTRLLDIDTATDSGTNDLELISAQPVAVNLSPTRSKH
jgi:hypothetical protein